MKSFPTTLAVEPGPFGIRINNLASGAIRTDMNAGLDSSAAGTVLNGDTRGIFRLGFPIFSPA